jgi:transcription termination factor NusB
MTTIIISIIASAIVIALLQWKVEDPPKISTIEELLEEGLTKQEARKELRAQREELRQHARLLNQTTRTGSQVGKLINKALKK